MAGDFDFNGDGRLDIVTADQATRDHYGEVLFRFVFRSLYRMGAFNGDPHPGNYLFHDDGTVTFLDFGLVKHFTADEMHTFGSMVKAAAVDHNHAEFRRIVEDAGMLKPDAPVSTDAVGEYFSHFYDTVRTDADMTWTREYANSIVRHTFDRTSPISQYATVPRAFVFIQRINLGLYALLGQLGATGNYRRIAEETGVRNLLDGSMARRFTEDAREQLELRKLMDAETPDEAAVMRQIDDVMKQEARMRKNQIGLLLKVRKLLTPEQRGKLDELMMQRRGRGVTCG